MKPPAWVKVGALRGGGWSARRWAESGGRARVSFGSSRRERPGRGRCQGLYGDRWRAVEAAAGALRKHQADQRQEGNGHREVIRLSERGKL
jgi:hypothetical protein